MHAKFLDLLASAIWPHVCHLLSTIARRQDRHHAVRATGRVPRARFMRPLKTLNAPAPVFRRCAPRWRCSHGLRRQPRQDCNRDRLKPFLSRGDPPFTAVSVRDRRGYESTVSALDRTGLSVQVLARSDAQLQEGTRRRRGDGPRSGAGRFVHDVFQTLLPLAARRLWRDHAGQHRRPGASAV